MNIETILSFCWMSYYNKMVFIPWFINQGEYAQLNNTLTESLEWEELEKEIGSTKDEAGSTKTTKMNHVKER